MADYFNDEGERVGVTLPLSWEDPDDEPDYIEAEQVIGNLLENLVAQGSLKKIGQYATLLAFLIGRTPFKTKAALALAMGVTPGRITQLLQAFPDYLQGIARLKNRQKTKGRPIGEES